MTQDFKKISPTLILLRGKPAVGKSHLARMLSAKLGTPFIDKDDVKDIVADYFTAQDIADHFSYAIMFNIAASYLKNNSAVICDSPLYPQYSFFQAQRVANKFGVPLKVIRVVLSDEKKWEEQMNNRKDAANHRYTNWDKHRKELLENEPYSIEGEFIVDLASFNDEVSKELVNFLIK